jgi:hypothetical protein
MLTWKLIPLRSSGDVDHIKRVHKRGNPWSQSNYTNINWMHLMHLGMCCCKSISDLNRYFRSKETVSQENAIRTVLDTDVQDIVALSRQRRGLQLLAL